MPLYILSEQVMEDAAVPISVLELQRIKHKYSTAPSSSINTTFKGNMTFISPYCKLKRCLLTAL